MITDTQVYNQLRTVIDPELGVNIVDLGLVYRVTVSTENSSTKVHILMTLTSPGCPLAGTIQFMVNEAITVFPEIDISKDVTLEITFDPPWNQAMMTEELKAEFGVDEWY